MLHELFILFKSTYATQRVDILPVYLRFEEIRSQSYHNAISQTEICPK